jgi:hypothetical protein
MHDMHVDWGALDMHSGLALYMHGTQMVQYTVCEQIWYAVHKVYVRCLFTSLTLSGVKQ